MPQVSDGQWTVIIKAEYSSYGGLRFTSNDNGKTWMYEGLSTGEGDFIMFYFQIFMSDKIDMVISVALPPVASLSALMLVAKKYVLSAVSI